MLYNLDMKLTEKTIKEKLVFEGKIISVQHDTVQLGVTNQTAFRELITHPGAVCVGAMTQDKKFVMVKQFRYGPKAVFLEFVAGKKEENEDPLTTVQRELEEETGYQAKTWIDLGYAYSSPALFDEKIHLYFACDLVMTKPHLDDGEFLEVVEMTLDDIIELIETNQLHDMKTIAMAYRIKHYLNNQHKK